VGRRRRSVRAIGTYYEVLGLTPDAGHRAIREAYRRLAREHHPDRRAGRAVRMAEINEAYRVLRDPARRAAYDAAVASGRGSAGTTSAQPPRVTTMPRPPTRRVDPTPARYPWKLALVMAAIGAGVVLVGAALYEPPEEPRPDNVLQRGSCVAIEVNGDAREVTCTEEQGELVVEALVPIDAVCPAGTAAHRDRQGMGRACVVERGS
jgi:molecular chaperone DnaJ